MVHQDVDKLMGHLNTPTTETYYSKIQGNQN